MHVCQHPHLVKARKWEDGDPLNINSTATELFPEWLRLGIPKAMHQTITGTFWGVPLEDVNLRTSLDRKAVGVRDDGRIAKVQRDLNEITQKSGTTH